MKFLDYAIMIVAALILIGNLTSIALAETREVSGSAKYEYAQVIVEVRDMNGKPIQNARVTIVESKTSHTTNKSGATERIQVPILRNSAYDGILSTDWGEITIIASANGFCSHIHYGVRVKPKQKRVGIVISLREIINAEDSDPIITIEEPDETFSNELIKKFSN